MTRKEKKWLDALRTEFNPIPEPVQEIIPDPIPKIIKPIEKPTRITKSKVTRKPVRKKKHRPLDDGAVVSFCTRIVSDRFRYYMSVYRRASRGDKKMIAEVMELRDDILEDGFMHAYANYINSDLSEILEYLERKL